MVVLYSVNNCSISCQKQKASGLIALSLLIADGIGSPICMCLRLIVGPYRLMALIPLLINTDRYGALDYVDIYEACVDELKIESSPKGVEIHSVDEDLLKALCFVNVDATIRVRHFDEDGSICDS